MITEDIKTICECGCAVSSRSKYCSFCGNKIDALGYTNYVRSGVGTLVPIVKPRENSYLDEVEIDMAYPVYTKPVKETLSEKTEKYIQSGSPIPILLIMTSVMIWIGGIIFFFVETTF